MGHTWTFDRLLTNTEKINPKTRGRRYPYTPKFEVAHYTSGPNRSQKIIVPFVGTKSVLISMRAWGVTQSSLHNITMLFSGVDIKTEDPHNPNYFSVVYEGQMYWIHKLDKHEHPLTARCSCADYFFTFAYYNGKNGCLYGPMPRPFVKKTNRPPRNPQGLPGMCKHIFNAWAILRNTGLTVN